MEPTTRTQYDNLYVQDGDVRYAAMNAILAQTEHPVDWAYEVWDDLLTHLQDKNNHVRTIAAQVLCNLAKSVPNSAC